MAWLYQQRGSKNWWLGYRVNGKQVLRSTKTSVRAEAERELEKVEILFGASRAGSLTEELFTALTGGGFLRSTGSNQAVAKELAGHTSDRVSDLYTHLPESVLTEAISKLPKFVK